MNERMNVISEMFELNRSEGATESIFELGFG